MEIGRAIRAYHLRTEEGGKGGRPESVIRYRPATTEKKKSTEKSDAEVNNGDGEGRGGPCSRQKRDIPRSFRGRESVLKRRKLEENKGKGFHLDRKVNKCRGAGHQWADGAGSSRSKLG